MHKETHYCGEFRSERHKISLLFWLLAVSFLIIMVFIGYGRCPRNQGDLVNDVSVQQVLRGGWGAMFFLDRSPVPQYPMPYGGWPPLLLIVQSSLALAGLPIDIARLTANTLFFAAFGIVVVLLCRKWKLMLPDPLVFCVATLGSAVAMFAGLAISHDTVPLALTLPWLLAEWFAEGERAAFKKWLAIGLCGLFIGLTDWHAASLGFIAAWYLFLRWRRDARTDLLLRLKTIFAITVIMAITFGCYLAVKHLYCTGNQLAQKGGGLVEVHVSNNP